MAYLFGLSTTNVIDCGASVAKSTSFTLWLRFAPTSVAATDRRLVYHQHPTIATGLRNAGLALNDAGSDNQLLGSFREASGPSFPSVNWISGFAASDIHTAGLTYDETTLRLYADTDATAKDATAYSFTPDTDAALHFYIGNIDATLALSADSTIYEVGWWTSALTGAQLAAMGSGTPPASTPSSYWPLIDNAHDIFGTGNGTVTGASVVAHSGTNLYTESVGASPLLTVLQPAGAHRGDY